MHLDPGNTLAKRGRLEVEQAKPRHADEHQLVPKQLGRRFSREHVLRRSEALGVVRAEVELKRAVRLQRYYGAADSQGDVFAAAIVDPQGGSARS